MISTEIIFKDEFMSHDICEDIVSDRGAQFTSRVQHAFCSCLIINASWVRVAALSPHCSNHKTWNIQHGH